MPQHFEFVLLLFDNNVERIQVKPKVYNNIAKTIDDMCYFVN
jgi:hypothetical protein